MGQAQHRNYKPRKGTLTKGSAHYRPLHETSFIREWLIDLTSHESLALSLIRPFDPFNMKPVLRKAVTTPERAIYNYFRVTLSSEDQNYRLKPMGRGSDWMVFDEVSGAFLGLFAIMDASLPWHPFSEWAGGKVGLDCTRQGHNTMHTVVNMKRCLPLYDFGKLTGGKLLALLGTSTEVIQMHELQYSLYVNALIIKTLHGKASQYNRLHQRGIIYRGEAPDGAGFYLMQMREFAKEYLLEKTDDPGKRLTYSAADQVAYWKERWLPNRVEFLDQGMCRPDPEKYRLSAMLQQKVWSRHEKNKAQE